MFHVTPTANVGGILRYGLLPQIGPRAEMIGEEKPAVYLFKTRDDVNNALYNWLGEEFGEELPLTLLGIDVAGLDIKQDEGQFEAYTTERIPPEKIKVLDEV